VADGGVAILVPMLGRADRIEPLLASIRKNTPTPYDVWFIVSPDDTDVNLWFLDHYDAEHEVYLDDPSIYVREVSWPGGVDGDYAKKLNEVMAEMLAGRLPSQPLIFLAAIDLHFHAGWLEACLRKMAQYPKIGVIGTNDLCNERTKKGHHSTHSLLTLEYAKLGTVDAPSRVLHEAYPHEYVDDEFVRTARARKMFVHAGRAHVEHLHPTCGTAPTDALYDAQGERMVRGRVVFEGRRHLWGDVLPPRRR